MTRSGFAIVHDDHPIFEGRSGLVTLRVYTRLCRRSNTERPQPGRPVGWVVGSQARLADELGLTERCVRTHLHRLLEVGLLVEWRPPVRGQVRQVDGGWQGLATEYLVVELATSASIAAAKQGVDERAEARAASVASGRVRNRKPTGQGNRRVRDQGTGRFASEADRTDRSVRSSDIRATDQSVALTGQVASYPMPTGTPTPVPTGTPTPVPTGTGEPSFETLDVDTQGVETEETGKGRLSGYTNAAAHRALVEAERGGRLPQLHTGERAGIATFLTAWVVPSEAWTVKSAVAAIVEQVNADRAQAHDWGEHFIFDAHETVRRALDLDATEYSRIAFRGTA